MNLTAILGSAAPWQVRELTGLDQAVRARHPLAVRVGVVGVTRAVGTSVAAGLAASVLASRGHRVLAVNSSRPGTSLLRHVGQPPGAPSAPEDDERRAGAATFADATEELPRATSGVYCLDLADSSADRWHHAVAPIARFFDYTLTDWGTRSGADLAAVTATSTLLAVVAPAERAAVQQAVDLAAAAHDAGTTALIVVTDPAGAWNSAWQELCDLLPFPATYVAHDKAHGEDRPRSSRRLPRATRLSGLRLAATIARAASSATPSAGTTR